MIELRSVRAVALDIAGVNASYEAQDEVSEFVMHVLARNYQIYLFSTKQNDALQEEDYEHPRLHFLHGEMPPDRSVLEQHPQLTEAGTLWVTDDPALQRWAQDWNLPLAHRTQEGAPAAGSAVHIRHLSELTALLDPTGFVEEDVAGAVLQLREQKPRAPLFIGVGGPPLSGFQGFSVGLRDRLLQAGLPLVELLDLSSLLLDTERLVEGHEARGPWVEPQAGEWLVEHVFRRARAGERVFLESAPEFVPPAFEPHLPLFISEESVVVVFAEMLFRPPLREFLDLAVLLEVSAEETTRRMYEIPPEEQGLDPRFTEQFLAREGKMYWEYLTHERVAERADIRVDANQAGAFQPAPERLAQA